jgi:hypothetical protein
MVPMLSVTRKLPSGRSAMDHGVVSLEVIVSTAICGEGFAGGGAPVWPGNAGFGFLGTSPAKGFGACACAHGNIMMNAANTIVLIRFAMGPLDLGCNTTRAILRQKFCAH